MTNQEVIKILRHYVSNKEHYEATELVLSALEKQTPKEPLITDNYHPYYCCPFCKHILNVDQYYCERCGQAIDWGVNNEKD